MTLNLCRRLRRLARRSLTPLRSCREHPARPDPDSVSRATRETLAPRLARELTAMSTLWLILLGATAGTGAGLLAGLIGIGGGIVVVPVVYYGLTSSGISIDQAVHIAVATSLAAILPASIVSFAAHWRAGNADIGFLRQWGPGIVVGVVAAQLTAPYVDGRIIGRVVRFPVSRVCHPVRLSAAVQAACGAAAGWPVPPCCGPGHRRFLRLRRRGRRHPHQTS